MEFGFLRLHVWQNSRSLVNDIYKIISSFPGEERFGLADQLRRAAISIPSNIAEGSGRYSIKEKIHFTEIAYGSLMEVVCQIILCGDLGLIKLEQQNYILAKAEIIVKQLSAYRRTLLNNLNTTR